MVVEREILSNHTPPPTQSTSRATCGAKPKHEHACTHAHAYKSKQNWRCGMNRTLR